MVALQGPSQFNTESLRRSVMAKGQERGNKEIKKPKKDKNSLHVGYSLKNKIDEK